MDLFSFSVLSAFSITVPMLFIFVRWRRLKDKYLPFIILVLVGLSNELLSLNNAYTSHSNAINSNIFVLLEFLLISILFSKLHSGLSKTFILTILLLGICIWITDNFIICSLSTNNSLFRMIASLLIVYLSIDKINQLIFFSRLSSLMNIDLWLALGFLLFHTYKTFVESFHIFPMPLGRNFYETLWFIMNIINVFSNLLFTFAILCLPKKRVYLSRL